MSASSAWDYEVAVIGGGPGGAARPARSPKGVTASWCSNGTPSRASTSARAATLEQRGIRGARRRGEGPGRRIRAEVGRDLLVARRGGRAIRRFRRRGGDADATNLPGPGRAFDDLLRHARALRGHGQGQARALAAKFAAKDVDHYDRRLDGVGRACERAPSWMPRGRADCSPSRFGREVDPVFRNVAVHAQFEGMPRLLGRRAGDIRMVTRPDRGWSGSSPSRRR